MSEFTCKVRSDGAIDITSEGISLEGIYPYVNERHILPFSISEETTGVSFRTAEGEITLSASEYNDELIISSEIEGFDHIHDVEPIGSATLTGADHAYIQGFGMEGPSGYFTIDKDLRCSHGIIGLEGNGAAAAVFTTDHSRYSTSFSARKTEGMYSDRMTFKAGINLEGTSSGKVKLPDIHIITGEDIVSCMSRAARIIAGSMNARTPDRSEFHWCSWYYHYENLSRQILDGFMADLSKDPVDFSYIQIDAGYTDHVGDWMTFNHLYPEGLEGAAKSILNAGYAAGIWIAPFMVGDKSDLYIEHPDWVIHEKNGSPYVRFRSYTEPKIWGNTDNDYYVLDITHPDAFAYLESVFRSLRGYGYTLYKTDFLLWGMIDSSEVIRYDNSMTSVMIIRRMLAMIREVIGEESYLLGSIAPFMPCIGYMDGMRIASDMGAQWTAGAFGPANLLQELPYDNYFNNIYWQNDPDSVILRDFGTHLTDDETWSIALLQALSGGIITTSDPVHEIAAGRRMLLDFIRPAERVDADFPFLTDGREELVITHNLHDWNLFYVLNPTDHKLWIHYDLTVLFGTGKFQYRFNRNDGDAIVSERCSCLSDAIEPHDSVLLFITDEPISEKPSNLWSRK